MTKYDKPKIATHNKSKKEWAIWAEDLIDDKHNKHFGEILYFGSPLKNGIIKSGSRTFFCK